MGYCISYESGRKRKRNRGWIRAAALCIGMLAGFYLHPQCGEAARMLGQLAEVIREELPVRETVEAFCRAVVDGH